MYDGYIIKERSYKEGIWFCIAKWENPIYVSGGGDAGYWKDIETDNQSIPIEKFRVEIAKIIRMPEKVTHAMP